MLADRSPTVLRPPTSLLSHAMAQAQAESAAASPSASRARPAASLSTPSFRLENLPRFHPAVYQSTAGGSSAASSATFDLDSVAGPAAPSHIYSRPQTYRPSSASAVVSSPSASSSTSGASSRDALRQYRDLVAGMALSARASSQSSTFSKPSKPRLEPLGSPGPVTPLALEEEGEEGYLSAGAMDVLAADGQGHAGIRERTELLDQLVMREQDRVASRLR